MPRRGTERQEKGKRAARPRGLTFWEGKAQYQATDAKTVCHIEGRTLQMCGLFY